MSARQITTEELAIVADVLKAATLRFADVFPAAHCCIVSVSLHGPRGERSVEWTVSHHDTAGCEIAHGISPEDAMRSLIRQLKPPAERARLLREDAAQKLAAAERLEAELREKGGAS